LATTAARAKAPEEVELKDPKHYRIVGKALPRLDTPDKVAGKAVFAIDVHLPGMLTAVVLHPPVFGARARKVKSDAARAVPGVKNVVEISSGVAVIAAGFWPAKRARDLLEVEWDLGPNAELSSEKLRAEYKTLAATPGLVARKEGDPTAALQASSRRLTAEYELPYLAHATMEPLACVVDLRPDG